MGHATPLGPAWVPVGPNESPSESQWVGPNGPLGLPLGMGRSHWDPLGPSGTAPMESVSPLGACWDRHWGLHSLCPLHSLYRPFLSLDYISADCLTQTHMQSAHALRSPSRFVPSLCLSHARQRESCLQRCAVEPHVCGDAAGDAASRSTVIAAGIAAVIAIVIAVAIAIAAHGRIVTAAESCHRNHRRSSFQPSLAAAKRHRSCHRSPPSPSQSPS